jgi:hypothetical protein
VSSQSNRKSGGTNRRDRAARLLELAGRITERDRQICRILFEHRVLTTAQVADLGFSTIHKAQERLAILRRLEVVDRFRPHTRVGSTPFHYILGPTGAALIAAEHEVAVEDLHWRRDVGAALASSGQLAHLVGCNGFFTALLRVATSGGAELAEWWSERWCAAVWGEVVRPDAYAVWVEEGWRLPFLLEFDLASERLSRLEAKLPGYAKLAGAAKHPTWVLFCFPTLGREAAARRVLAHPAVPVATAALKPGQAPNQAVWLAVGEPGPRRRLIGLGYPDRVLGSR